MLESGTRSAVATLRESVAICFGWIFGGRGDTTVHLASCDFGVDEQGAYMWFRLTEKGKRGRSLRRVLRLPLAQIAVQGHDSILGRVALIAASYVRARQELCARMHSSTPEWLLQLPGEQRPTTTTMGRWLDRALHEHGIRAPAGFAYQGHSIRALAASAMNAIGVTMPVIKCISGYRAGAAAVTWQSATTLIRRSCRRLSATCYTAGCCRASSSSMLACGSARGCSQIHVHDVAYPPTAPL